MTLAETGDLQFLAENLDGTPVPLFTVAHFTTLGVDLARRCELVNGRRLRRWLRCDPIRRLRVRICHGSAQRTVRAVTSDQEEREDCAKGSEFDESQKVSPFAWDNGDCERV